MAVMATSSYDVLRPTAVLARRSLGPAEGGRSQARAPRHAALVGQVDPRDHDRLRRVGDVGEHQLRATEHGESLHRPRAPRQVHEPVPATPLHADVDVVVASAGTPWQVVTLDDETHA